MQEIEGKGWKRCLDSDGEVVCQKNDKTSIRTSMVIIFSTNNPYFPFGFCLVYIKKL